MTAANPTQPRPSRDWGAVLTIGFGTTTLMWGVGYVCRLPGLHTIVPNWLLFAAMVASLLVGGAVAGRCTRGGLRTSARCGVVAGLVNLLMLGSVMTGAERESLRSTMLAWVFGSIALSAALTSAGALLATTRPARPVSRWPSAFAIVACASTLLLLAAGGIVTGFQAGMAVPDWPSTFGSNMFLYPLARMTGGIYFEHTHRLFGSLVGLTTLVLAVYVQLVERRGWVRLLAITTLVAVIGQGLLGGFRVTENNLALAVVHGVLAQVFFTLLALLAAVCSTTWQQARPLPHPSAGHDRALAVALVGAIVLQLVFGAVLRHFYWGLHLHITMAVVVIVLAAITGLRHWGNYAHAPALPTLGVALFVLVSAQFLLGFAALLLTRGASPTAAPHALEVAVTTAHQTVGALLLAAAGLLAAWNLRCLLPAAAKQVTDHVSVQVGA